MFHCVCVCVHTHAWRGGGSRGETNKVCVEMGGEGGGGGSEAGSHSSHLKSLPAVKGILFQETGRRGKGFTLLRRHVQADIPT